MSERFFSAQPIAAADRVTLDGAEAHHLLHVMRATAGDAITLFDDSGAEFAAVVEKLGRAEVALRIIERYDVDRELAFSLAVGVALPKGDRQKWLVEKLTELGVTTLVPLMTGRGVAQPNDGALDRLRRAGIEAAKQCGRNRLLQVARPQTWTDWITENPIVENPIAGGLQSPHAVASATASRRLIAHRGGSPLAESDFAAKLPTCLAIGPEGGFTVDELEAALDAGWQAVDLGPRILRVETAAVAMAAAIVLGWG